MSCKIQGTADDSVAVTSSLIWFWFCFVLIFVCFCLFCFSLVDKVRSSVKRSGRCSLKSDVDLHSPQLPLACHSQPLSYIDTTAGAAPNVLWESNST